MPIPLTESLQAALGDAYRIERELVAGGMSRVFLASEASLNRAVVVKVLPAEMANEVSAARFKREIEVTAQLQHPHVLPILSAGARDGLLWYVMPYVEGESLRHRLNRERQLPIADATRILHEVADALAYAHSRGVVHRDVKPENILIEEGHAVLADFGIARALLHARTDERLTATGLGLGTPGYMAPEQATDGQVDARADVYALGVLGYEMLAGLPPFTGASAQAVIAAHLTSTPRPLRELRPDTPPALAATIARALAKLPDERLRSAAEFRDEVRPGNVPNGRRRSRTLAIVAAAGFVLVAGIAGVFAYRARTARPLDGDLLVVVPFDVLDPSLQLWREGMVDLLSRNLDAGGSLRTVSPSTIMRGWTGRADVASATALGRRTGARLALMGTLLTSGSDSVRLNASLIDVTGGPPLGQFQFNEASDHVARFADSVSVAVWRLLGRTGRADLPPPRVATLGTTSLPAMKAFLRGEQFLRRSAWDSSVAYFEQAVALDSGFALAHSRVGLAIAWTGSEAASATSRLRAGALNRGLSPRDSILLLADSLDASLDIAAGPPDIETTVRTRRQFDLLEVAARRYSDDAEIYYRLGDAYFHLGLAETSVNPAQVLATFDRAIALDSAFTPAYLHPVELALRFPRDRQRTLRYLRAYLGRAGTAARSGYMGAMAAALDRSAIDDRAIDSILTAFSEPAVSGAISRIRYFPDTAETAVRLGRAMLAREREPGTAPLADITRSRIWSALAFRGHLKEASAVDVEMNTPQEAETQLLARLPGPGPREQLERWLQQYRPGDLPSFLLFLPVLAGEGDTAGIALIARPPGEPQRPADSNMVDWMRRYLVAASAYQSLARGDSTRALRGFESLGLQRCAVLCRAEPLVTARLLVARGRFTAADSILSLRWPIDGPITVLYALERARVSERLGKRAEAIEGYSLVVDAWANADAELQPMVSEAREALGRLRADSRVSRPLTPPPNPRP